jgi:hypothetical protein
MEWNKGLTINIAVAAVLLTVFQINEAKAQVGENRYIVYFSDKDNTPFSLDNPEAYLSQRAIERRQNQGIAVDAKDLPVDPVYIQTVLNLGEVTFIYPIKWFNAILIETEDPDVIEAIEDLEMVEAVEVSPVIVGSDDVEVEFSPLVNSKSNDTYGPALNQIEMINGIPLHDAGFRGEDIWIGVFDGGFSNLPSASVFQSLIFENRILATKNFVHGGDFVYEHSNHGTYVMSTMAANQLDLMIGTAPKASYLLCITENVATERRIEEANWVAAAEYADSMGIDIINTSLGYTTFDVESENYTYADMDGNTSLITRGSDIAASRGILPVTSAGNKGSQDWFFISAPADGDSVLAIGAVNAQGIVTNFSSRGPSFDGRVKPNVMAQGGATTITNLSDSVGSGNGTSFSGPIISGMAACLWQSVPFATAWQVHQAIEESAHLYNMPNDSMGYGIPDFELAQAILTQLVSTSGPRLKQEQIAIFPNPYHSGELRIVFPDGIQGHAQVRVFDITGRVVKNIGIRIAEHGGTSELSRHLSATPSGTYIIEVQTEDGSVAVGKLIRL